MARDVYCAYCKEPILEGEKMIVKKGKFYHFDPNDNYHNCYYEEYDADDCEEIDE